MRLIYWFFLVWYFLIGLHITTSLAFNNLINRFSHINHNYWLDLTRTHIRHIRQTESEQINDHTPVAIIDDGGARCLVRCLKPMINKAPQDAGNDTLICPQYDDQKIQDLCHTYTRARRCLDECPNSALKNLSMSGFKPLQFMCVDRNQDFKKYMPCLSTICDELNKQCESTCGSLDDSVRRLAKIQHQVRGPGSRTRGADLDVSEIMQTVADNCQLVQCVGNCTRTPMTKRCGPEAYDLQRDTVWTMLSSMAQALTSVGLSSVWPPQCQDLIVADKQRHPKTDASKMDKNRRPNHTDRFADKQIKEPVSTPNPNIEDRIVTKGTTITVITNSAISTSISSVIMFLLIMQYFQFF